jgi:microsomal epoxide hydrolase
MAASFAQLPESVKTPPKPFKLEIPEENLRSFKELLRLSRTGPKTFENQQEDGRFGVSQAWLENAKTEWEKFDWYVIHLRTNPHRTKRQF